MSKTKMRCSSCGKWFQSANAKEITCPDCMQKARKEKLANKNAPPEKSTATVVARPKETVLSPQSSASSNSKPKPVHKGTNQWLDNLSDVKIAQPDEPPVRSKPQTPAQRETHEPGGSRHPYPSHGPQRASYPARPDSSRHGGDSEQHPAADPNRPANQTGSRATGTRAPFTGGHGQQKPWQKQNGSGPALANAAKTKNKNKPKVIKPPRPKVEKTPPPEPFKPTSEQIQQVEERYLVLAQPIEFDGIRTQIAQELHIPKKAIKAIIKNLRERNSIPSWWELQTYKGSNEELEQIRAAYEPYLPVPPVGVHKKIADTLSLKPGVVYQAIKTIRLDLNLPQYNDPDLHAELPQPKVQQSETTGPGEEEKTSQQAGDGAKTGETQPE